MKRVTTVLEPDTAYDTLESTYTELTVSGSVDAPSRKKDIAEWEEEFSDILTKEPGLTPLAEFSIEMEDSAPIAQRPYNTPLTLRDNVDKETDWLIDKGSQEPVGLAHGNSEEA